jgi:hypothetical protein
LCAESFGIDVYLSVNSLSRLPITVKNAHVVVGLPGYGDTVGSIDMSDSLTIRQGQQSRMVSLRFNSHTHAPVNSGGEIVRVLAPSISVAASSTPMSAASMLVSQIIAKQETELDLDVEVSIATPAEVFWFPIALNGLNLRLPIKMFNAKSKAKNAAKMKEHMAKLKAAGKKRFTMHNVHVDGEVKEAQQRGLGVAVDASLDMPSVGGICEFLVFCVSLTLRSFSERAQLTLPRVIATLLYRCESACLAHQRRVRRPAGGTCAVGGVRFCASVERHGQGGVSAAIGVHGRAHVVDAGRSWTYDEQKPRLSLAIDGWQQWANALLGAKCSRRYSFARCQFRTLA